MSNITSFAKFRKENEEDDKKKKNEYYTGGANAGRGR